MAWLRQFPRFLAIAVLWTAGCSSQTAADRSVTPGIVESAPRDALAAGKDVTVLRERGHFFFDDQGKKTYTYQVIYRIDGPAALSSWSTISAAWSPWFQSRPELAARVTDADGNEFEVQPSDVSEVPVKSGVEDVYSDRRRVQAPLPGIGIGAQVEQTIIYRDKRAFFSEGSAGVFYFGMPAPVAESTVLIDVPASSPFQFELRGLEADAEAEEDDGRRRLSVTLRNVPAIGASQRHLPSELARYPHLVFSTAASWQSVARAYGRLVDEKISSGDVTELISDIPRNLPHSTLVPLLVSRLHARIRYTGMEFGQQAIVPWPIEETIERRFGDCKDKAAVLVAMLRQFGVDAHLALLRSGLGEDVRPGLPGLEVFNHALVYVGPEKGQKKETYIDATAEFSPVGDLPVSVQGRLALVARPETTQLKTIPAVGPERNLYRETREYYLSDFGPMRVIEKTRATGTMEERLRTQFARASKMQVQLSLQKYVKSSYRADALGRVRVSPPTDVSEPFAVEVEARGAGIGFTGSADAFVQLQTGIIFSWLPPMLRLAALAGAKEEAPDRIVARKMIESRKVDLVLPEPYSAEVHFKVTPPIGYTLRKLPPSQKFGLGPGSFETKFTKRADDVVEATFSFSTGQRRFTPTELRALVDGLRDAWEHPIASLQFDHRGSRHLAAGRIREGLTEYRHLVEINSKSALHQARMAEAFLRSGLGTAARRAAARAVALDPRSKYALYTQGWVHEHDSFGRHLLPGFDRKGAIDAYERLRLVDEANSVGRRRLAVLYEYDELGNHFSPKAQLDKAIDEYRSLRAAGEEGIDRSLLVALFWARRFAEAAEFAAKLKPTAPGDAILFASLAVEMGLPIAKDTLAGRDLSAEERREATDNASNLLALLGKYGLARKTGDLAVPSGEDVVAHHARMALLDRLVNDAHVAPSPQEPKYPIARIIALLYDGAGSRTAVEEHLSKAARIEMNGQDAGAVIPGALRRVLGRVNRRLAMPGLLRDQTLASIDYRVEGSDEIGYHIVTTPRASGEGALSWFVVKEEGAYRISSISSAEAIGRHAWKLLSDGKTDAAKQWIQWGQAIVPFRSSEDPLTTDPFAAIWSDAFDDHFPNPQDRLRLSAAMLMSSGRSAATAIRFLEKYRRSSRSPGIELRVDQALARAYFQVEKFENARAVAVRLRRRSKRSIMAYVLEFQCLYRLKKYRAARALAEKRLAAQPEDPVALDQLSDLAAIGGEFDEASGLLRKAIGEGPVGVSRYNNLAWLLLFVPEKQDEALENALEANTRSRFKDPTALHTLATVYAEQGNTQEAMQLILKRMEVLERSEPEHVDWYVLGRVMEQYELEDLAREAYLRVEQDDGPRRDSTFLLAQRRLEVMKGAGGRP